MPKGNRVGGYARAGALAVLAALPVAAPQLVQASPPDYEQADLDPDNDRIVAPPVPLDDCAGRLARAGIAFRPAVLPLKRERTRGGEVLSCGAEQVVTYLGGPAKIGYDVPPLVTCRLALALGRLEQVAQEEALRRFGRRITRITQGGTYNCRKMVRFDFVSEHSYANAIDLKELRLEGGRRLRVREHFGKLAAPPRTPEAEFLRALSRRAFDERLFSVVLTPYWDKLHDDHFHFDLARYHVDGTRPRED
ncbi:MAG: extensin family protein [Deltaproteobacteria bacterium]